MSNAQNTHDSLLVSQIRNGDQEAFKRLFYSYFEMLASVGGRMCGDTEMGKEVAQRILIRIWEQRATLNIQTDVRAYLKRMVINEALAIGRTRSRRLELSKGFKPELIEEASAHANLETEELQQAVHKAVEDLPDKCREVFKLSRFEELSYKEIGDTLDISVKTVENHVGRALRQLRESLRQYLTILF